MRPGLTISVDTFKHGPAELIVVIPLASKRKGIPLYIRISPLEGALTMESYAKREDLRSVSKI